MRSRLEFVASCGQLAIREVGVSEASLLCGTSQQNSLSTMICALQFIGVFVLFTCSKSLTVTSMAQVSSSVPDYLFEQHVVEKWAEIGVCCMHRIAHDGRRQGRPKVNDVPSHPEASLCEVFLYNIQFPEGPQLDSCDMAPCVSGYAPQRHIAEIL